MKRLIVMLVFLAGIAMVAYASFSNGRKKTAPEKKIEKKDAMKEKKKQCKRSCMFS
jgi:hypothetical protein